MTDSIKILMALFPKVEKLFLKCMWNTEGHALENNPEKEQSQNAHTFQFWNLLQSYSNQNSVVLT